MSILVSSKNVFLSTQPSGGLSGGGIDDQLNSFRAALNNVPLQTNNGEYGKLTLIDFTMYRNFYKVNQNNNTFFMMVTTNGVAGEPVKITIPPGDYRIGSELSTAVANAVLEEIKLIENQEEASVSAIKPTTNGRENQNGDGILSFKLRVAQDSGIESIKFQCRNYNSNRGSADHGVDGEFNDSYALLGAKRITEEDNTFTNVSLNSVLDRNERDFTISGFYQCQDNTIPNIYIRCQEVVDNLESENFKMGVSGGNDTHIVGSTILGKVNVSDEIIRYNGDTSSPYFIMSDNRNISELFFTITDSHGRPLPAIDSLQSTSGNLFVEMTINFSVYTKGTGQPVNNNIENNGNRNAMIIKGGVN
tara:strand:- start:1230 stop:2315 length:1086 start_codon:yes stop_codon:yes gene_type:complete